MNIDFSNIKHVLKRLKKKDPILFDSIKKKMLSIASMDNDSISHFKNLKHDLHHLKRVHVGSFVLIFRVECDTVVFEEFVHHDKAYSRK